MVLTRASNLSSHFHFPTRPKLSKDNRRALVVDLTWTPPTLGRTPPPVLLPFARAPPPRRRLRWCHDGPDRVWRVVCVGGFIRTGREETPPDMPRCLPDGRPDVGLARVVLERRP
jgi:hypothetical protein